MNTVISALSLLIAAWPAEPAKDRPTLKVEPPAQEIVEILQKWEAATSGAKTYDVDFHRYKYDCVFEIEFRAEGRYFFAAPNLGCYELRSAAVGPGDKSKKRDERRGLPYQLKSDLTEKWVWTEKNVLKINSEDKTYESIERFQDRKWLQGLFCSFAIPDPPELFPCLVGGTAEELARRFKWKLVNTSENEWMLEASPRWQQDVVNLREFMVVIDRKTALTRVLKTIDTTGNVEVVHVFSDAKINQPVPPGENPLEPNLEGLRNVLSDKATKGMRYFGLCRITDDLLPFSMLRRLS